MDQSNSTRTHRRGKHLNLDERIILERSLKQKTRIRDIASILGVDVMRGKHSAGKYSMPGLWNIIDTLPPECRPRLLCGDIGYGNEKIMLEVEKRKQPYLRHLHNYLSARLRSFRYDLRAPHLFKLKQTKKVKNQILRLERDAEAWEDAGDGWQGCECYLKIKWLVICTAVYFSPSPLKKA